MFDQQNKYQDPSMINVNSEDFRSLPEEIQHEIIKDKIADKKLTQMDAIPQVHVVYFHSYLLG